MLGVLIGVSALPAQRGKIEPSKLPHRDASGNRFGDGFGWSVAVSGDTAVVGTPTKSDSGEASGAAYVFVLTGRETNRWTQVAKLTPRDARAGLQFGRSVAIQGDTVIVGAIGDDEHGEFTGSAYIFERHRGGPNAWGQVAKLRAGTAAQGDVFGESVSISGDRAVVGAPQDQAPLPARAGFATVFQRHHPEKDAWGEVARLTASDGASGDRFAASLAISGNTVIVGAPDDDHPGGAFDGGSAYIFSRTDAAPGPWNEVVKLMPGDAFSGDGFGWDVTIDGDTAIVGAPGGASRRGQPDTGVAYVFTRDAGAVWAETAKLTPGGAGTDQAFGRSVAISANRAVVGASSDEDKSGSGSRSGSTYVYSRRDGTRMWEQVARLTADDGRTGDQFGWSVSLSGTIAIVGAPTMAPSGSAYSARF
jgi:hypothetical protein